MLEDVGGSLHRHDVVHDEFAESGQIVAALVKLLDLGVVVDLFVVVVHEDVVLDEVVDELNHRRVSLERKLAL